MQCPGCQRENAAGSKFCTYCGTQLETGAPSQEGLTAETRPEEDGPLPDAELREVRIELRQLGLTFDRLQDRISRLELTRPGAAPDRPQPPSITSAPASTRPSASAAPSSAGSGGGARPAPPPWAGRQAAAAVAALRGFGPPSSGFSVDWEQVAAFLADEGVPGIPDSIRAGDDDSAAVIEISARLCYMSYGRGRRDIEEFVTNLLSSKDGSVFEHVNYGFVFTGVSRSLTHELVRHRAGFAYSQRSQRYVDETDAPFVLPPALSMMGGNAENRTQKLIHPMS
ncbi:MAG: FAD-dependent thymidylate synthase [Chloroflexi bacterium]|nr:FAD-dependent thymidylate synthase [Chloroflexota bacterium]